MSALFGVLLFLVVVLEACGVFVIAGDCPLNFGWANFTLAASACSNPNERGLCCRYINAFVAVSIAHYANSTGKLGVPSAFSDICLSSLSEIFSLYGIPPSATMFCGLGPKIGVSCQCDGRGTVLELMQSSNFVDVTSNCEVPVNLETDCRRCLNSVIMYLHHLIGANNHVALSMCRNAVFVVLANQGGNVSADDMASCFFGVQGLTILPGSSSQVPPPISPPSSIQSTVQNLTILTKKPLEKHHHPYHLALIPTVGVVVIIMAVLLLLIVILLIRQKTKELKSANSPINTSQSSSSPPLVRKCCDGSYVDQLVLYGANNCGPCGSSLVIYAWNNLIHVLEVSPPPLFQRFSYKETIKATDNFSTVIGKGGFGTVYRAKFSDGTIAAVKRMNKISKQGEEEFCREMELLARLHHRNLVALRGFCIENKERFLVYEYMENGCLKDHLHGNTRIWHLLPVFHYHWTLPQKEKNYHWMLYFYVDGMPHTLAVPGRTSLSWSTRLQIAIDVANALEYLHFYCNPPLCHRDIKSSNILLGENFVAKVADFGLAHASRSGAISFEPVNTDIRGTPGYMDPEYVVTQELTEKSDIYSYGVLLLELVSGRKAIQDGKNIIEWSRKFISDSRLHELVDPAFANAFDFEQLQAVLEIILRCTRREGRMRPSIKRVLRMLSECLDSVHNGFSGAAEDGGERRCNGARTSKSEFIQHSGDARCLISSSSTSRSYCSRSILLETGSPQSPGNSSV
ncbi:putative receptor-like protein kinase [Apostasia shenzhenica]|uniref:Putative receptor-like protein kinase n=1 Tax=Apostasia shenzhenica TaxID=1088818 RepID=A0A2I0A864_9ASPA|nr:putative receptor-like protein kinase [Apostasia shenzhenica]